MNDFIGLFAGAALWFVVGYVVGHTVCVGYESAKFRSTPFDPDERKAQRSVGIVVGAIVAFCWILYYSNTQNPQ